MTLVLILCTFRVYFVCITNFITIYLCVKTFVKEFYDEVDDKDAMNRLYTSAHYCAQS